MACSASLGCWNMSVRRTSSNRGGCCPPRSATKRSPAFYLGARAQGLGKLDEAYDWYRAAVETALPQENEYRFSLAQLALWSRENKSLSRMTKEATP